MIQEASQKVSSDANHNQCVVDTGQMNPGFFSLNTFLNILYYKKWVMKGDPKTRKF